MKKVVATVLIAAMTAAMAGCGATKETDEATKETNETSETSEASEAGENDWGIDEFNFVLIPGEDTEKSVQLRDEMGEDLSEVLGIPVNIYRASDYNAAVEALRTGSAQLAYLGPFSYVTASERADAECVCVYATNGEQGYKSYIVTKADSGIESLEDLEGKTFGFVDPSSTSGNIIPTDIILEAIDNRLTFDELHVDGQFFKSATYAGTHEAALQAVVQGNVDAAAVASSTYDNQIEAGNINEGDLKIIYESPTIPGSPLCIKGDLPEDLKELVTEFLLNYDDDEYFGGPDTRYQAIDDSEFDYLRDIQKKYGLTD